MIELTDEQADKICEIVDYRFHHYNPINYHPINTDEDGEFYMFWPVAIGDFSHAINRETGELIFDKWKESAIRMYEVGEVAHEFLKKNNENYEKSEAGKRADKQHQEMMDKKQAVKDYLISEGLIKI